MSETTEHPAPEPEREPAPTPAPESTPAPDDAPEQTPEEEAERKSRGDRRFAAITAKLSAAERLYAQKEAEAVYWRQQAAQGGQPAEETQEQRVARIEREADVRAEQKLLAQRFHDAGGAQYPDWQQKTRELIDMGADAEIARLLIRMPGGVHVAAALADDPEALQRIAGTEGTEGRAMALGRFAARIDGANGNGHARAAAPTPMTRAPAPVRPVTGRASPVFNEYTASPEALADYYLKKDLERHRGRR
jgi:hypothetical protein